VTEWQNDTDLFLRREFTLSGSSNSTGELRIVVDNDIVSTYLNEVKLGVPTYARDGCDGVTSEVVFPIPSGVFRDGKNVIAFHVRDRGSQSFFNFQLRVDVCPNPAPTEYPTPTPRLGASNLASFPVMLRNSWGFPWEAYTGKLNWTDNSQAQSSLWSLHSVPKTVHVLH